jgi:hypothetical protein
MRRKVFEAKFETTCAGCRKQIRKRKRAHMVDGLMLHVHCRRPDPRLPVKKKFTVWFEHLGEYYDDVLVSLKYDKRAVAAIRALPPWAGHWDATSKVWRIHPGYAEQLAATLWRLGYTVRGGW